MVVLPGDKIGAIEEYMPSLGTFSSNDEVYSSMIGELELDKKAHLARVKAKTRVPKLQGVGAIALGQVAETNEMVAIIDLLPTESMNVYYVPNGVSAVLHVSNVRRGYVKDLRQELKIGDLIRAKIIEANEHTTRLAIDSPNLGVIKAFCSNCRQPLKVLGQKLVCGRCGSVERRKIAQDYGSINLR